MGRRYGYYTDLATIKFDDATPTLSWIHAMPVGEYQHPQYGKLNFTPERIARFAASVKNKIRGIDPDIDYDHKDKTNEAAGWVKDADTRADGLWLLVDWTKTAVGKIKEKAYRYFSPEFDDEWEDAQGNKHQDVIFGGGITNRPFLKDLIPLNLSELSFKEPIEEEGMDPKKLRELLGLKEDATDEQVDAKAKELAEAGTKLVEQATQVTALTTQLATQKAQLDTMAAEVKQLKEPKPEPIPVTEELKRLAETNPTIKAMLDQINYQNKSLVETQKTLREVRIDSKLRELDSSKVIMTPVVKGLAQKILMEVADELVDPVWELLKHMRDGKTAMVELGERAGGRAQFGVDRTAGSQFTELVNQEMAANKLSYVDAVVRVTADNPALYEQYRQESFAFRD
jgi:phage I-like protein